ncbi:MAG: hypothetical protein KGO82_19170 [Bacteroidota bacterium]|nr:hypothetical protein [Bacteroidota bacterium]
MSIAKKTPQQLADLKNTLELNPHIEDVFFTAEGNHYFNAHELMDKKGKGTGKKYGYMGVKEEQYKVVGERRFYKLVSQPLLNTFITQEMTREEVLKYELKAVAKKAEAVA